MTSWFVPGRLEVFGKHTDYAGGRSLLAAVDRGITVSLAEAKADITASSSAADDVLTLTPGNRLELPAGHWGGYLQAVVDRLCLNFGELRPAKLQLDSDLPLASGMSSSSALVVALALALIEHNGLRENPAWQANINSNIDLASYLACIENGMSFGTLTGVRGVGTFGGSEDHTAMLCCHANQLTAFSFCPTREEESVAFPTDWSFVVAVSGVLAEKTSAALEAYNRASIATRDITAAWNDATGSEHLTLADALASDEDALEGLRAVVAHRPDLSNRLQAFLTESEQLIPAALKALAAQDFAEFGRLADQSQLNADNYLGNQIRQTNRLQALARELGAAAASSFGAGFGGSVWALLPTNQAEEFAKTWLQRYLAEYPELAPQASTLITRPGGPARSLT